MQLIKWLTIALFLFPKLSTVCYAQPYPSLNIRSYSENDGLSSKVINAIAQDKNGIIWIASDNGISRYDAQSFKTYYSFVDGDKTIPLGIVKNIYTSREHGLWITTATDLFYMDILTEKFYNLGKFKNPFLFKEKENYHLADDINFYEFPSTGKIETGDFKKKALVDWIGSSKAFGRMFYDKQQSPWSVSGNKIFKIDKSSRQIEKVFPTQGLLLQSIFFDSKNRAWVATWGNGIFLFDVNTGLLKQFPIAGSNFVAFGFNTWQHNNKNYIIVCSDRSLIMIEEETLQYQLHDSGNFFLNAAFNDRDNNLWLATNEGVKFLSAKQNLFNVIPVESKAKSKPSGVYVIKQLGEKFWVSKRYYSGIFEFNNSWHLQNHWSLLSVNAGMQTLMNSREAFDFTEYHNKTYISTDTGIFVVQNATVTKVIAPTFYPNTLPKLRNIEINNDSTWLIRSYDNGVYVFDYRNEKFTDHYPLTYKDGQNQPVHFILKTRRGQLLATTYEGIHEFNAVTKKFERVPTQNSPSEYMLGMAEDKNGMVWISSSNGIFNYDPVHKKIIRLFTGYSDMGFCYRICVDQYNNVWFNNQKGYWCWMQDKQQMARFSYNMGLPDNRLEAGFYAAPDGYVYGGSTNAIVQFNPTALINYEVSSNAIITEIQANDKQQYGKVNNDSMQTLVLSPNVYNVDLLFSVTDYSTPGHYELFYQMKPGKDWVISENGNINFSNLSHGNYEITVKGKNNLTGRFSRPYILQLIIKPHWYQTITFKLLAILIIGGLSFYAVKRRINQIRKEARLKQKIAESEMQLLRSQMNPHFIFNSLNSIENFIMQNEKRLASDYLNKFARLIRLILDSSRYELIPLSQDMEALQLYIELEKLRLNHKFSYTIVLDSELQSGDYRIPPLLIQPYVENAILHGLSQSELTDLHLEIQAQLQDDTIQFIISDNGIGREQSALYKSKNKPRHKSVGMDINKERILRFNKNIKPEEAIKIIDLYDEERKPTGTKMEILITAT